MGLMVVGRYTQTRQRWLRAKIVKSKHSRHYKKGPCCVQEQQNDKRKHDSMEKLENQEIEIRNKKEKKKKIRKREILEKEGEKKIES